MRFPKLSRRAWSIILCGLVSYPGRCKNVGKTSPRRDGVGERGAVPRRAKRHFIGSEEAEAGKRDVLAAMR